jgi:ketosteroid isomerase-like protein
MSALDRLRVSWAVLVLGCGSATRAPSPPEIISPELSPALAPLNWWLGDWQACDGKRYGEHWSAASGAMYGVALSDSGFEVMIVDDGEGEVADGVLRFIAMPQGQRAVEFTQQELGKRTVTFVNPAHDDPKQITYARDDANLRAVLFGEKLLKFDFCPSTRTPAPELEAADRTFAADTAARGAEGWLAAFDPQGGMMRRGSRVEGAAIGAMMAPLLAKGRLAWDPVTSHRDGALGFTVGKATYTGEESWQSTYVTIWRQQPDGVWKVLFDTGRPVQKPAP